MQSFCQRLQLLTNTRQLAASRHQPASNESGSANDNESPHSAFPFYQVPSGLRNLSRSQGQQREAEPGPRKDE